MSKAQLKKALGKMETPALADMLIELYEARPEAKEYLEYWLKPDAEAELEKYKVKIHRLFFTTSGRPRKRPTITSIRQIVKFFETICYDPELTAQLYLYICSVDIEWLRSRRNPLVGSKSTRNWIDTARLYIENAGLEDRFGIKLDNLTETLDEIERHAREIHPVGSGWRRWRR